MIDAGNDGYKLRYVFRDNYQLKASPDTLLFRLFGVAFIQNSTFKIQNLKLALAVPTGVQNLKLHFHSPFII